ncbi:hypothetical protein PIB30_075890, partial [Stylosanthes scabra]|nr:hypothetical protein [Stylosanthes scabra]
MDTAPTDGLAVDNNITTVGNILQIIHVYDARFTDGQADCRPSIKMMIFWRQLAPRRFNTIDGLAVGKYRRLSRRRRRRRGQFKRWIVVAEVAVGAAGGWGSYEIVRFRRCPHLSRHY